MSIEMLNWVFLLEMESPTDKSVLLALANHADPEGYCWPSVRRLCLYTALSERTVQNALRRLEDAGLIGTTERSGTSTMYRLHPRTSCTSPPQEVHPTPAAAAPKPSYNHKEPSTLSSKRRSHRLPEGWQPGDDELAWAHEAYPNVEVENETDRFRDYWYGNGKSMVDWRATWRNWIRRAATYQRSNPRSLDYGARRTADNHARLRAALDGTST